MRNINTNFKTALQILVIGFLAGIMASCTPKRSFFEPTDLPEEYFKSGLVRTPSPIYRNGKDLITIKTIDGFPPTFLDDKVVVAPGVHSFQISLELHHPDPKSPDRSYVTRADVTLDFEVEAKGEYLIDAHENEDGLWIWATDLQTDITVAGRAPRNLPPRKKPEPVWADEIQP